MNQQVLISRKIIIAIVTLIFVLVGITVVTVILSNKEVQTLKNNPALRSQAQVDLAPTKPILKTLDNKIIPTLSEAEGGGIDIESKVASDSAAEILKLQTFLPYLRTFRLTTGLEIDVLINEQALQDNPWSLSIELYGIDYQTPTSDKNYTLMKNSFREAAAGVFSFIESNGINPKKIIFTWGDREFIQSRAEEWLK